MKNDYNEIVRRSIRKDFEKANFRRNKRISKPHRDKDTHRVLSLAETCEYWRFRRYIVGRLVRITETTIDGVWVEFIHEGDRENLNNAAGWSEYKRKYFLQGAKFD